MEERLQAIEARLTAASPGPWEIAQPQETGGWGLCIKAGMNFIARMPGRERQPKEANADFIANAPADIAYLLEEIRRLKA